MAETVASGGGWITTNDRHRSATVSGLNDLARALERLNSTGVERLLDIGCGYGGLSKLVGEHVEADEIHGVDIDEGALPEACAKGVRARAVNVESDRLPYADSFFDLVLSFGMMDYLRTFDSLIGEMHRVLRPGGQVLVSLPNLASWHNRLILLLGFQPRDVEISQTKLVGTVRRFQGDPPSGHIHTPTTRAFVELMEFHGFETRAVTGGSPLTRPTNAALVRFDRLMARRPTLARRFFYVGSRPESRSRLELGARAAL